MSGKRASKYPSPAAQGGLVCSRCGGDTGTAREMEQDAVRGWAGPSQTECVSALDLSCRGSLWRTLSRRMACLITSEAAFQRQGQQVLSAERSSQANAAATGEASIPENSIARVRTGAGEMMPRPVPMAPT